MRPTRSSFRRCGHCRRFRNPGRRLADRRSRSGRPARVPRRRRRDRRRTRRPLRRLVHRRRAAPSVVTVTDAAAATQGPRGRRRPPTTSPAAPPSSTGPRPPWTAPRKIPGTAWWIDPVTNQVVVSVDSTVTGAKLERVKAVAARLSGAVRARAPRPACCSTRISGGQAIYAGGGGRCSLGFNVRSGGTYYFLTAGHCTDISASWYANSARTTCSAPGPARSFPGNDYGIVRHSNRPTPPATSTSTTAATGTSPAPPTPSVGQSVQRCGSTTGLHGGTVTATERHGELRRGLVTGLIQTKVCAEPGDSGGSLFAGGTAPRPDLRWQRQLLLRRRDLFQPVPEALSRLRRQRLLIPDRSRAAGTPAARVALTATEPRQPPGEARRWSAGTRRSRPHPGNQDGPQPVRPPRRPPPAALSARSRSRR